MPPTPGIRKCISWVLFAPNFKERVPHLRQSRLRTRSLVWHKNPSTIYTFYTFRWGLNSPRQNLSNRRGCKNPSTIYTFYTFRWGLNSPRPKAVNRGNATPLLVADVGCKVIFFGGVLQEMQKIFIIFAVYYRLYVKVPLREGRNRSLRGIFRL